MKARTAAVVPVSFAALGYVSTLVWWRKANRGFNEARSELDTLLESWAGAA